VFLDQQYVNKATAIKAFYDHVEERRHRDCRLAFSKFNRLQPARRYNAIAGLPSVIVVIIGVFVCLIELRHLSIRNELRWLT